MHCAVFLLPCVCVDTHVTRGLLCPQGVPDVRLAYIQFALSFLIAGDDSTVVQVLEVKGRCAVLTQSLSVTGKLYPTKKSPQPLLLPSALDGRMCGWRSFGQCGLDPVVSTNRGIPVTLSGRLGTVPTKDKCKLQRLVRTKGLLWVPSIHRFIALAIWPSLVIVF